MADRSSDVEAPTVSASLAPAHVGANTAPQLSHQQRALLDLRRRQIRERTGLQKPPMRETVARFRAPLMIMPIRFCAWPGHVWLGRLSALTLLSFGSRVSSFELFNPRPGTRDRELVSWARYGVTCTGSAAVAVCRRLWPLTFAALAPRHGEVTVKYAQKSRPVRFVLDEGCRQGFAQRCPLDAHDGRCPNGIQGFRRGDRQIGVAERRDELQELPLHHADRRS